MCSDTVTIGVAQCAPDKSRFPGDGASGAVFRASLCARHFRLLEQPCRPDWCQLSAHILETAGGRTACVLCGRSRLTRWRTQLGRLCPSNAE